jgi:hypothetical protein
MLRAPKHRLVSDRFLLQISALPRQFSAAEIRRGKQLMNALLKILSKFAVLQSSTC